MAGAILNKELYYVSFLESTPGVRKMPLKKAGSTPLHAVYDRVCVDMEGLDASTQTKHNKAKRNEMKQNKSKQKHSSLSAHPFVA